MDLFGHKIGSVPDSIDKETYTKSFVEVVFPKVRITDHKEFMYGAPCRRYKFLDIEKPSNLPYATVPVEELRNVRDVFEECYVDAIKHRFVYNFFDRHPRNLMTERLEEKAAVYFNLLSLTDAYIKNIEKSSELKKNKKQRYRRNKKKNDKKKQKDSICPIHGGYKWGEETDEEEDDPTTLYLRERQKNRKIEEENKEKLNQLGDLLDKAETVFNPKKRSTDEGEDKTERVFYQIELTTKKENGTSSD